jgi:hypothetical protein
MDHFLSLIYGDYDNFPKESYKDSVKKGYNERYETLQMFFKNLNFKNIRLSKEFEINENPNDNFFYILTDIIDFDVNDNIHEWDKVLLKKDGMDYIINNDNCFLIFLHDNDEIKNSLSSKIDEFAKKYRIFRKKIMSFSYSDLTYEMVYNLISNNRQDTFNIVYENWSEDGNSYYPNLSQNEYGFKYRIQVGLFRFYNFFKDIRAVHIDEVETHKSLNFYYFINGDQLEDHFRKNNTIPLSNKVKEIFLNNKNFNIVILNEHEYEKESFIVYIDEIVKKMGFDSSRVYLMTNNSKLQYYKDKNNLDINAYSLDFLVMFIANHMVEFGEPKFIEDKAGDFFMCHNRGPKPHRYGLLCMLKKHGILDYVDWSLILGWYRKNERKHNKDSIFYEPVFNNEDFGFYKSEIEYFGDIDIKKSKFEENKTWFDDKNNAPIEWKNIYEYQTYENSYVNIVTESCYIDKDVHITEKSMKPFYFYQFPLFLSSYQHVKFLKERFGFDMFDDILDHSYDNEPDERMRLIMFFNEIKRLNENKELLITFYKNNKERFIYNKEIVVKINNSKRDYDYFKNLIHKNI